MALSLSIDITKAPAEEDDSELMVRWIGTAIGDVVAAQAKDLRAGNVEVTVDPAAREKIVSSAAGASIPCTAQVEMHLTPKVDNVAANRVSQIVNEESFAKSLSSVLKAERHRHWPLSSVSLSVTATEPLVVSIASNGEAYQAPESNRLQSANPRSTTGESPSGMAAVLLTGGMVLAAIAALVFRVVNIKPEHEGFQPVSQVELQAQPPDRDAASVSERAGSGRSNRRQSTLGARTSGG